MKTSKNCGLEQPDVVSSAPDYARRFAGEWGRYLLSTQNSMVAGCLGAAGDKKVLEVGGGHGQLQDVYRQAKIVPTIFGTDQSNFQQLSQGTQSFVVGDMLNLSVEDQTYDTVISIRQISHIRDWRRALMEMCRVARERVIIDYSPLTSFNVLKPVFLKLKRGLENHSTRDFGVFRNQAIEEVFIENGFQVKSRNGQFFLPIVVHRVLEAAPLLRGLESMFRAIGVTDLAGSPVTLHATRDH